MQMRMIITFIQGGNMKLDEVMTKRIVVINQIDIQGVHRKRLQEMGLIVGRRIYVQKFAPMGNPMEIKINGQSISIRNEEAHLIEVSDSHE